MHFESGMHPESRQAFQVKSKRNHTQQVLRPIEFQFADAARRAGGACDAYDTDIVIEREREFEDS
jgi:hypothetical protein